MKRVNIYLSLMVILFAVAGVFKVDSVSAKTLVAVDNVKSTVNVKYKGKTHKKIYFATLPNKKIKGKKFHVRFNKDCYVVKNKNPKSVKLVEESNNRILVKYKRNIKKPIKFIVGYGLDSMVITVKNTHGVG